MKVVAFLPVKGSSSRVINKNIKLLDSKPLFLHTLEKLCAIKEIDEVYLDTESDEIIELASEYNHKVLRRDPSLASNDTDGNKLFMNEVDQVDAEIYIQILCTSPFIKEKTIIDSIALLKKESHFDSVVLLKKEKLYEWKNNKALYNINSIPNSIDLPETVSETMGLYIMRKDAAISLKRRIGNTPFMLFAEPIEAIDVNIPEDFHLANLIQKGKREDKRKLLNNIKNQATSSMFSDILDELGYNNQIIKDLKTSSPLSKILGPASTLKLRKIREGEAPSGIYDALKSYNTIVPNDVIIVENEINDYAYFGELNANLAIRSGASGAIIGGKTRDVKDVLSLGFPVFSQGSTCQDVKGRAVVESMNKTIQISGVYISPGTLVFADSEGVIVIPKEIESEVLTKVLDVASTEKNILVDIATGKRTDDIIKDHGFF